MTQIQDMELTYEQQAIKNGLEAKNITATVGGIQKGMNDYYAEMRKCSEAFNPTMICNLAECAQGHCQMSNVRDVHLDAITSGHTGEIERNIRSSGDLRYKGKWITHMRIES